MSQLVWFDRTGKEIGTISAPGDYFNLQISPDGRSVLFDRVQPGLGTADLWTLDLARGVESRLTSERGSEVTPVWFPSGRSVAFGSDRGGGTPHLYRKDLGTGVEEELRPRGRQQQAMNVSPDGQTLAFVERSANGNFDAFLMPLANPASASPWLLSRFVKMFLRFSPDGRAIAYMANDTGSFEVYVAPLEAPGAAITVSGGGGALPRWSRDGRELFYVTTDRVMSTPIRTTPSLELGTPVTLFRMDPKRRWDDFDVSADGRRFLAIVSQTRGAEQPVNVIANWTAEQRR